MNALISIDYTYDFVAEDGKLTTGAAGQAIEKKLASSERGMNIVANETLYRVQKAVGLRK